MRAYAKYFIGELIKACHGESINLSMSIELINMIADLPDNFKEAINICNNALYEAANNADLIKTACRDCYRAISSLTGPGAGAGYYGSLITCDRLGNNLYR